MIAPVGRGGIPTPFSRLRHYADALAAIAIVALGAWVLLEAGSLREGPGYAAVGPRVFPMLVGIGFLASGLSLLVGSLRARPAAVPYQRPTQTTDGEPDHATALDDVDLEEPTDWTTLLSMAVLLALYVAAFLPLGFLLSSAIFLVAGAWTLGSRALVRDVVVGMVLSLLTYLVFTRLLGLELPAGPLEEPLRAVLAVAG